MFDSLGRCARVPVRETAGGVWMGAEGAKTNLRAWGGGTLPELLGDELCLIFLFPWTSGWRQGG